MGVASVCKLCGSERVKSLYDGPIRSGGAESQFIEGFTVQSCSDCGISFLDPFPDEGESYYEGSTYWVHHHSTVDVGALQRKFDAEQLRWLSEIGIELLRGKRVADFGCGAGLFLDLVKGVAAETTGVDLAKSFQAYLEEKGHRYVHHVEEVKKRSIDIAVSFDTLEHLKVPKHFLEAIFNSLVFSGRLFLGVPNQNDFLKKLVPKYLPFFYHKSHLFYFNAKTLLNLLKEVGFRECEAGFVHKYDLMNLVVWAREGKAQGKKGSDLFDQVSEDSFRMNLERQGIASHIFVRAIK